jgi:hypothetical protein
MRGHADNSEYLKQIFKKTMIRMDNGSVRIYYREVRTKPPHVVPILCRAIDPDITNIN